ncbi:protein ripply3 [Denticeps clupeoides]|uniref:Protein ripply3 n=1 Tax=Denticeps clupeoides TaxID=299321 RepID=A0AAY4EMK8_9TELE|nr:protein ripply3 [Denticeps clupeoides]
MLPPCHRARAEAKPAGAAHRCWGIWRPWSAVGPNAGRGSENISGSTSFCRNMSKSFHGFQHPVRLFMPKSRTQEYLSHLGEKVLASFPVQATLHFYNDDSSDSEEDEDEGPGGCPLLASSNESGR